MATISFARGVPAPECLPVEELADCARVAIERDGRTVILSYGPSSGYAPLREWVADRHGVDPKRVFLTNGSLQGRARAALAALALERRLLLGDARRGAGRARLRPAHDRLRRRVHVPARGAGRHLARADRLVPDRGGPGRDPDGRDARGFRGPPRARHHGPEPQVVAADATVRAVVEQTFPPRRYTAYPVVDGTGVATGLFPFHRVATVAEDRWGDVRVHDLMVPLSQAIVLDGEEDLGDAVAKLLQTHVGRGLVVRDGRLEGLLSITDAQRLLEVRTPARARSRARPSYYG